jgi:glycosyltransferase involved in cell wall biosynthesis
MVVSFFSNFLNHHQIPLCEELYRLLEGNFYFVATEKINQERLGMGYQDESMNHPFSLNSYESETNHERALWLGLHSDVVIIGAAPDYFIRRRLQKNLLTFRYNERLFRKGLIRLVDPRVLVHSLLTHTRYRSKNLHMLGASAFTRADANMILAYPGKCWTWGYFTRVYTYDIAQLMQEKTKDRIRLLWVGRFLSWKRPGLAIGVAQRLRETGVDFELTFVGKGELWESVKSSAVSLGLSDYCRFKGPVSPDVVREEMKTSDIFLFTSNKEEGWGAVLNEAMNSGCAVVASDAIGSVPFLVKDGENGLMFHSDDAEDLFQKVLRLVRNEAERIRLGNNAYNTMISKWRPEIAAERFIRLSRAIRHNQACIFEDGPCAPAPRFN